MKKNKAFQNVAGAFLRLSSRPLSSDTQAGDCCLRRKKAERARAHFRPWSVVVKRSWDRLDNRGENGIILLYTTKKRTCVVKSQAIRCALVQ